MTNNANAKRIAKNTLMLYFRQILILVVSLYTVRVILNVLGVEDYGIYNVVGGIVTFFSFLSRTMASATQRFFSFALGENDQTKLNITFSVNLVIYSVIAVIAIVLLESVGLWFVYSKLNVPTDRFSAACFIYHFSVLTFIVTIISSPFMAIIIAHEDMHIYAYVSIVEALLKLFVVFALKLLIWDKLKVYGVLLFIVGFINASIYIAICMKKYTECQFRNFYWNKKQFFETIGFTGWTLFGQVTTVARTQAVTILINQVFNPVVVSARSIATQVTSHINVFSANFNTGLYPPIIKSYAAKDKNTMFGLVFNGCKFTFFLMWVFALPLFLEMDYILTLWLKNPPDGAILFTKLALLEVLINAVSLPLTTAARAPGKMKVYELSLGTIQLLIFLVDFILFKFFNAPAFIVFIVAAIGNFIMFLLRIFILKYLIDFPISQFFTKVIVPLLGVVLVSGILSYIVSYLTPSNFIYVFISVFSSVIFSIISMMVIALNREERNLLLSKIIKRIKR